MFQSSKSILSFVAAAVILAGAGSLFAKPYQQHRSSHQEAVVSLNDSSFDPFLSSHPIVIVDFYADWCSPCRNLKPVYEQVAKDMSGKLAFGKLNVDAASQTSRKHHVSSLPTLVIFKDGKEVKRKIGGCDAQALKNFIKSAL